MSALALLYFRVSTDRQDNSIAAQEKRTDAYLELRGLATVPELCLGDPETSGRTMFGQRTGGARVLHFLEHGLDGQPVDHLVVSKVDRLGRNAKDLLGLLEWMQAHGKVLHVVDFMGEPVTSQGIVGKVMFGMCALFAEMEVERIRERIVAVLDDKFADGKPVTGCIPFGCDYVDAAGQPAVPDEIPQPDGKVRRVWPAGTRVVPNEREAQACREIHHRRHVLGESLPSIARWLNYEGIPTKQGGVWNAGRLNRLLQGKHFAQAVAGAPCTATAETQPLAA